MIVLATLLAIVTLGAGDARAVDGVLEINQACVAVGCLPGDAPGFPVTLAESGAYRLTSNLVLDMSRGGDDLRDDAVVLIDADDVHLDLGGFSVLCRGTLDGSPCRTGTANGVLIQGRRATIRDGSIVGHAGDGVSVSGMRSGQRLIALNVAENGRHGVDLDSVSRGHVVSDCYVSENRSSGIIAHNSVVERNRVLENGSHGITGVYSIIRDNVVRDNAGDGMNAVGALIISNQVWDNGMVGIRSADGNVRLNNVRSINDLAIYGGHDQDPCASGGNRAERTSIYGEIYGCLDGGGDVIGP